MDEPIATTGADPVAGFAPVKWAAKRIGVAESTFYDLANREPERYGVERFGRRIMVRVARIEAIVDGA